MSTLAWPLERNQIRRSLSNHAFGMVRNGGARAHQGWDLLAARGTPCYAIADGTVKFAGVWGAFGRMILLEFEHRGRTLYAAYCHLSTIIAGERLRVRRGDRIGHTGNTGNAASMRGEDQHLHFEIRTSLFPGMGLAGRLDPATLLGPAPIGWTFFEGHGQKVSTAGVQGLKVVGVNVRERIE